MKKLNVSETEKNRILDLHENVGLKRGSLLNEQNNALKSITIPLSAKFQSGKYLIKNSQELDPYVKQIQDFLQKLPQNQESIVTIYASESQVPNYDREKYPSTGDKKVDFTEEKKLPPGDLAKKRMSEIERVVKEKFGNLPNVKIVKLEPKIGDVKWEPSKGSDSPEYTKDQYVAINVKASGTKPSPIPPPKKQPCTQYDFYFGNVIFRTLDKIKATQFLNALAENPQTPLTPNCVNFVGNTYKTIKPPVDNEYKSHFPQTIGFEGQYKLYKSRELYDKDPNKYWIDPIKQYGMVSV